MDCAGESFDQETCEADLPSGPLIIYPVSNDEANFFVSQILFYHHLRV